MLRRNYDYLILLKIKPTDDHNSFFIGHFSTKMSNILISLKSRSFTEQNELYNDLISRKLLELRFAQVGVLESKNKVWVLFLFCSGGYKIKLFGSKI